MRRLRNIPSRTTQGGIIFLLTLLFFALVMYCAPFSSDDLEHILFQRTQIGQALHDVLYYGNGRFLGNLGTIYLCNNTVLRVSCKALSSALLAALLPAALGIYSPRHHLLSFLLIICMSGSLFGQVFTWTSGFTNYIPPILFCLIVLCLLRSLPARGKIGRFLIHILIICFGTAAQLFNEVATVFNCLLSVILLAIAVSKNGRRSGPLTFTLASFAGAAIMYLLPIVFYVENNRSSGYRSVAAGGLKSMVASVITHSSSLSAYIAENLVLCLLLCFCAYHVLHKYGLPGRYAAAARVLRHLIIIAAVYFLCNCFVNNGIWHGRLKPVRHLLSFVFVLIPLAGMFIGVMLGRRIRYRLHFAVLFALSLFVILPLLIVNPISMRCLAQFYVTQAAVILLYCARYVEIPEARIRTVNRMLCLTAVSVAIVISMAFVNIRWLSDTRDRYIARQMEQGATEIAIFPIPYDYVFWDGPATYPYMYHYSQPGDIRFIAIPYEDWSWMYGVEETDA